MAKRLLVMAGGTGGHVFPGLAVADCLAQRGWKVHWLGTATRMEAQTVPNAGYPISFIDVVGVRGNGLLRLLKAPFQIIRSIFQARNVIRTFEPDVVLGMGGFASGPGGVAAWSMGIPLVLHEQNAVPGLTNKLLARIAQKVLTGFDATFDAQKQGAAKYQWVGNPVRQAFGEIELKQSTSDPVHILVVGGSLGAKALNDSVPQVLKRFEGFEVKHQCGAGHLSAVTENYQASVADEQAWQVTEFIDDMVSAFRWADLLICRAGALTVAEVAASGVCAIFVPLPHAVDDHQTKNAATLVANKAAFLVPQNELSGGKLQQILERIFDAPDTLIEMGHKAREMARFEATQTVANTCQDLAKVAA